MGVRVTKSDMHRVREELRVKIMKPLNEAHDKQMRGILKEYMETIYKKEGFVFNKKHLQFYNTPRSVKVIWAEDDYVHLDTEYEFPIPSIGDSGYSYTEVFIEHKGFATRFKSANDDFEAKKKVYYDFDQKVHDLFIAYQGKSTKALLKDCPEIAPYFPDDGPTANLPAVKIDVIRKMLREVS